MPSAINGPARTDSITPMSQPTAAKKKMIKGTNGIYTSMVKPIVSNRPRPNIIGTNINRDIVENTIVIGFAAGHIPATTAKAKTAMMPISNAASIISIILDPNNCITTMGLTTLSVSE